MKSLDSFKLTLRDNWVSCKQTLSCLRLYGDRRISRAQPRINANEILLQHDWLLFILDIIGSQKHIATYNFNLNQEKHWCTHQSYGPNKFPREQHCFHKQFQVSEDPLTCKMNSDCLLLKDVGEPCACPVGKLRFSSGSGLLSEQLN